MAGEQVLTHPPVTLTPTQFAKTGAAKSGGTYGSYLKYVTNARARRSAPAGSTDALAPRSQAQMQAIVNGLVNRIVASRGLFKPQTDAQLEAQAGGYVQPQIDAQIKAITDEASGRAQRGMDAIGSLGTQLQSAEAPAASESLHNALMAAAARASIGQTLGQGATDQGAGQQSAIADKLAAMGNNGASDQVAANAGALGKNIGATVGSEGATAAADTVNRGAANSGFASALPGITALAGIRSGRILQEQTNAGVKDNVGRLEATVPGLVSGIFQTLKGRDAATRQERASLAAQAAQLGANLESHMSDQEIQKATARQGFGLDTTKLGLQANQFDQSLAAKTEAAAAKAAGKSNGKAQAAVKSANALGIAYLNRHVKPTPIYSTVLDSSTTPPVRKQVITGYKGYPGYYDMIHGIESQIAPVLGPYATRSDVVRMAQRLVNADPHYKPGVNGRPGTGIAPPPPAAPTRTRGDHGTPK